MKFKQPYVWGRIILLTTLLWHIHTVSVTARSYFFGKKTGGITEGPADYNTCDILPYKAGNPSERRPDTGLTFPVYIFLPFYLQKLFVVILMGIPVITFFMITGLWLRKLRMRPEETQRRTRKTGGGRQIIKAQAKALKALGEAKIRFLLKVIHKFRSPALKQMMAKTIPGPLTTSVQSVRNNAEYLPGLNHQVPDISGPENEQMKIKSSTADVVAFTGNLVQEFQAMARKKKQRLVFAPTLPKWKIHFDREKLRKIIYNLLSHTVNYTPGQRLIEFFLSKKEYKGRASIEIRIKDAGSGISADALSCNCFSRAEDAPVRKGADIDLVLVKELVELLDGEITVENILGKGPVFTVRLPVLPVPRCPDNMIESIQFPVPKPTGIIPCENPWLSLKKINLSCLL